MKALRVLLAALVAGACATNPATGQRQIMLMSESQEIQLGRQNDADVRKEMGAYSDAALQQYIAGVGARLSQQAHRPSLPWTYTVVDEPAVNAFALPGGFIYITRGILPFLRNEAELAAVLGHETGHVDARHSAQQYSTQTLAGGGLAVLGVFVPATQPVQGLAGVGLQMAFLKFSRQDELEADQLGVGYVARGGWDPHGMPGLLATLARLDDATGTSRGIPNWALTHPPAADRVARVQDAVAAAPPATTTNAPEFERHLDGLVYGDSREKGIIRGREFLHPVLRIAVTFPDGWNIENSADQVTASPEGSSNVAMVLEAASGSGSPEQLASSSMRANGWLETSGERTTINGLDSYLGTYQGTGSHANVIVRAAYVRSGDQVFVVAGLAPSTDFDNFSRTFSTSLQSFRSLSREEADRVQPNRVQFYTAKSGDTWGALAKRAPGVKASTLAIMNGRDAATPPRAGDRIRIVIAG